MNGRKGNTGFIKMLVAAAIVAILVAMAVSSGTAAQDRAEDTLSRTSDAVAAADALLQ